MARPSTLRTASLAVAALGIVFNFTTLAHLFAVPVAKLEAESEWEGVPDPWRVSGVRLLWGLVLGYFASATVVCCAGLVGIVKHKPALVRVYRDYSIADFVFSTLSTLFGAYGAFRSGIRAEVCEELSKRPELLRDMAEMGLSIENCDIWVERAMLAFMGTAVLLVVIRLHFLIAVCKYYAVLVRSTSPSHLPSHHSHSSPASQRIYILRPTRHIPNEFMVYAPVPLSTLSTLEHAAAQEAWVSPSPGGGSRHHHRDHHHHRREPTGTIQLPIAPGEALLPAYSDEPKPEST